MNRIVVVGNGLAAHRLTARLAALGHRGPVTVLGAEPVPAYQSTLLTSVLDGTLPPEALTLPPPPEGVRVRTGVTVHGIDRARRLVHATTPAGRTVKRYDTLVLATGARTAVPGPPDTGAVRTVRTLADCVRPVRGRVAVVGGGVLGVETASALRRRGHETVLAHAGPHPMSRGLDPVAGALVASWLEDLGVELRLGTRVTAWDELRADTVLLCTGTTPETSLARAAGLEVHRGILVDARLRTSDPSIHALGDCASPPGGSAGHLSETWSQADTLAAVLSGASTTGYVRPPLLVRPRTPGLEVAYMGGGSGDGAPRTAAAEPNPTTGGATPRSTAEVCPRAANGSSGTAGAAHRVARTNPAGTTPPGARPEGEVVTLSDPARGRYARLVVREERVVGAVVVGLPRAISDVGQLYDQGRPVPGDRVALLLGSAVRDAESEPAALPDDAVLCHCNHVTKGDVVHAWHDGAHDVRAVAAATRATTGCGGCADGVRSLCAALRGAAEPLEVVS